MSARDAQTESIAVLGGGGFLGARVVRRALDTGAARVASVSRDPDVYPRLADPRLSRISADALQEGALESALRILSPRRIVLCTALARGAECEAYPKLAHELNVELPRRIAEFARERGARLVYVSTDLVFGARAPALHGFREDDPTAPMNVYGETKAAGEAAVLEAYDEATVCRLPLLYGDSEGRDVGASDELLAKHARGEQATLFTDEYRTPLDVDDAAAALVELTGMAFGGRLHVAGPTRLNRYELGQLVLRSSGVSEVELSACLRPATRAELGMAEARGADNALDSRLAEALLSTPLRSPAQALAERA